MFDLCIFLAGYKGHECVRNDDEKPRKWKHTVSQGREYKTCYSEEHTRYNKGQTHYSEKPQNQRTSRATLFAAAKIPFCCSENALSCPAKLQNPRI